MKKSFFKLRSDLNAIDLQLNSFNDSKVYNLSRPFLGNVNYAANFVLNDYLALSNDNRIKLKAINSIRDNSESAKTIGKMHGKAEEYLSWIFDRPVLLFRNSSVFHGKVLQSLIGSDDAVIFDEHVHSSLRFSADLLMYCGKSVENIGHNNIQCLEERISILSRSHSKIWYVADSIYPSPGDVFPLKEIKSLLEKYEQLHIYVDDSKGMSWAGKNGEGYVHYNLHHHPKVMLSISLNKGFGCEGTVLVCYTEEMKRSISHKLESKLIKTHLEYYVLASIIESAKIHLSNEIYMRQLDLKDRIAFFNKFSLELELPIVNLYDTPVAFFETGKPDTSQEICFNLLEKGYYLNVANFPLVPYHRSGIMANVTLYQSIKDMKNMLKAFREEYCKLLMRRKLKNNILRRYKKYEYVS